MFTPIPGEDDPIWLPSRELTYPPDKAYLSRWFSELPKVGWTRSPEGNIFQMGWFNHQPEKVKHD